MELLTRKPSWHPYSLAKRVETTKAKPLHLYACHSFIHKRVTLRLSRSKCIQNRSHTEQPLPEYAETETEKESGGSAVPKRYKLIVSTALAFVICNMDKVNLSVAIIPMSHQFQWSSSVAGLVQSSFFCGYALSLLPAGWFANQFSGKKVLEIGVLVWSFGTALVPLTAGYIPGLVMARILVGIGEGVSPPAATDLISRTVPSSERSRAVSFVFSGLNIGSVLGLLLAPTCIEKFGWESVFYAFALLGFIWYLGFQIAIGAVEPADSGKTILLDEKSFDDIQLKKQTDKGDIAKGPVPWNEILRSRTVWTMIYAHFCGSWGHYTTLSWLPTYFSDELHLDLTNAALVSLFPPLGSILVSAIASSFADMLISSGVSITTVRKICQTVAFISPASCMTIASMDLGLSPWITAAVLSTGLSLSSFALSGLYCSHQDISKEYASVLLGLTNTAGALPGIFGVALTGYLLDQTHSWGMSLFGPSIFFYLTGTVVWLAFARCEPQKFEI